MTPQFTVQLCSFNTHYFFGLSECKVSATEGGEDGPASVAEPANKIRARYSKAQARQRFRKGKF